MAARTSVTRSLARMPSDARQRAVAECVFIAIGDDFGGVCLPTHVLGDAQWLIVVDAGGPDDLETIIAHEVAHALLGHNIGDHQQSHEAIEAEARALVRTWGFEGLGAAERGQA